MSRLPEFTLYGDGRALILPPGDEPARRRRRPQPGRGRERSRHVSPTLREVRLSEAEVQALLKFALVDGRLGTARDAYMGGNMDAPSTVFELNADGADRSILVTGLTDDPAPGPDAAALRAFSALVARLRSIGTDADYTSDRTMAVITETSAVPGAISSNRGRGRTSPPPASPSRRTTPRASSPPPADPRRRPPRPAP